MLVWLNSQLEGVKDVYVVGGCLRDALLYRPVADVDLVVANLNFLVGLKQLAKQSGYTVIPLDSERQIYRLVGQAGGITIDLCSLQGETLAEDLAARDFTINALACPWQQWYQWYLGKGTVQSLTQVVLDYHEGLRHLRERRLVAVSPEVFERDPLRVLRLLRFAVQLGFETEDTAIKLARDVKGQLDQVAPERQRLELVKLFQGKASSNLQHGHWGYEILSALVPELEVMAACEQNYYHKVNVYVHCWTALAILEEWWEQGQPCFSEAIQQKLINDVADNFALLKFVGLLHDIGKPAAKGLGKAGRITFHGHEHRGVELIKKAVNRLRFSNKQKGYCVTLVKEHMRPLALARLEQVSKRSIHRLFREVGNLVPDLLVLSMADMLAKQRYNPNVEEEQEYCRFLEWLAEQWYYERETYLPAQPITGRDVLDLYPNIEQRLLGTLLLEMNELYVQLQDATKKAVIEKIVQKQAVEGRTRNAD